MIITLFIYLASPNNVPSAVPNMDMITEAGIKKLAGPRTTLAQSWQKNRVYDTTFYFETSEMN